MPRCSGVAHVSLGETTSLVCECTYSGNEQPQLDWYRQVAAIVQTNSNTNTHTQSGAMNLNATVLWRLVRHCYSVSSGTLDGHAAGSFRRQFHDYRTIDALPTAHPQLQVCCCGPGGQEISIGCCSSGVRRANAGSATSSAYVGS